ncbi:MAG TPA: glycosyltransferase family 4 protein, partial [Candidatus Nanoarchaeia archaeon]|nr:glycosyltransferase family 4 protein [Candidatus Nanoarchaeia archaeon]
KGLRTVLPTKSFHALAVRHHAQYKPHKAAFNSLVVQHHAEHLVQRHRKKSRVLMFGWEFPPQSSGGLGTACEGLTTALAELGVPLTFVVPHVHPGHPHVNIRGASTAPITLRGIHTLLTPYLSEAEYESRIQDQIGNSGMYGSTLFLEVHRYARAAEHFAAEPHDIIHAHDWMTFPAAIAAKRISGKPFIAHVHATEFDRSGDNPYPAVAYLEQQGLQAADHIIAVSGYTKQKIMRHYGIPQEKISVVHNAVAQSSPVIPPTVKLPGKTVLFLGRLTLQKGPDYFLRAAKKVLEHEPNVRFIIAGSGDMERRIIEEAAALGIARNMLFAGFAKGSEVDQLYRMADLYVMPSVSEPFGITPLEALRNNTPVLISKQSGVSEVLKNALRVDFWDIDEMANKILSTLRYPVLQQELRDQGKAEIQGMTWRMPAEQCLAIYERWKDG